MFEITHPEGPCRVLVADPPWKFGDKVQGGRGAESKYEVLSISDIMRFPLPALADDAILFLWRVAAMPDEWLAVARAWGFEPKAEITWVKLNGQIENGKPALDDRGLPKLHMGMGRYTRASTEKAAICTRGKFKVADMGVRDTFFAPVGEHSEKPEEFFALVRELTGGEGAHTELFARKLRPGYLVVGNELPRAVDDERPAGAMQVIWTPRGATVEPARKLADDPKPGELTNEGRAKCIDVEELVAPAVAFPEKLAMDLVAKSDAWTYAAAAAYSAEEDFLEPEVTAQSVIEEVGKKAEKAVELHDAKTTKAEAKKTEKLSEQDRQGAWVRRAIEEKILTQADVAREGVAGAFVKLQFRAPKGFFDRPLDGWTRPKNAPTTTEEVKLRAEAGTGGEIDLAQMARVLAQIDIPVTIPQLAAMKPDVRYEICAWVNGGYEPKGMPEALRASALKNDWTKDASVTAFGGCNACEQGKPYANGTEYLHTGHGPLCAVAGTAAASAAVESVSEKTGKGKKEKKEKNGKKTREVVDAKASDGTDNAPATRADSDIAWTIAYEMSRRAGVDPDEDSYESRTEKPEPAKKQARA